MDDVGKTKERKLVEGKENIYVGKESKLEMGCTRNKGEKNNSGWGG